ncbi:OmpA family protein [Spirosoma soli]|uniref:OmpA family protein n=1 Tax=Spirosoma soli TaxID=1770529 RepID=A0ABW5M2H6_9BACT
MFASKTPWIVLLMLWMIGSTWWHVCKIKQLCVEGKQSPDVTTEATVPETPPGADGYTIADGTNFRLDLPGNFSFAKSGANANMNTLGGSLQPMITYLKANPGRTLDIIGYYTPAETNATSFPDLGEARAEGIKQYLVQQGIPASSITIKGKQRSLPVKSQSDSLYGGIDFAFSGTVEDSAPADTVLTDLSTTTTVAPANAAPEELTLTPGITEEGLAAAEKFTSVFEPIDLYFPLAEANYIKTPDTQKFFEEAIKYLADHKDKKLLLTGYTDNSGPDDVNLRLSRDRANQVKARLRKSGIDSDQITVEAKGEADPKASNDTREGRKANRRVTVVVQ